MQETGAIITVVGKDRVGIIAGVAAILAQANVNILDISQTIMSGYFTMIMFADLARCGVDFKILQQNLEQLGAEIGVQVTLQHEEVFNRMHRI